MSFDKFYNFPYVFYKLLVFSWYTGIHLFLLFYAMNLLNFIQNCIQNFNNSSVCSL